MLLANVHSGSVLIAQPSIMGESFFERSVILLAKHEEKGSVGFVLNKPLGVCLSDLIKDVTKGFEVFSGGPVEQDNLYFIHNVPNLIPNSIEISKGIYWGGDFEIVKYLIENNKIDESNVKFFLGYAGWGANQLIAEISDDSWIVKEKETDEIISIPHVNFWKNELKQIGGDFLLWINSPKNPSHN